ncbi:MAG TPA: hypothetical protein VHO25_22295 [Polyangiaceae bacterium]|nr:hypothetical protein [Polyangiaceae bacterium]
MTLASTFSEDRRLCILRLLHGCGYTANESVLQSALEEFGHKMTRDQVRNELTWLEQQGFITLEVVAGKTTVAHLTEQGGEVATGRGGKRPGVKLPSPESR